MYLVVRKGKNPEYGSYFAVYGVETVEEAARLCEADPSDVSWRVRRTGRWDSEDRTWAVFLAEPEEE